MNYKGLQELQETHGARKFSVLAFPCNQFGGQEPGSPAEIQEFCSLTYGVTFPLLEKQNVNGPNRSALYDQLVNSDVGAGTDVRWNFEKFLVNEEGTVLKRYLSSVAPETIAEELNQLL